MNNVPLSFVRWQPCYRIIPTRYPSINVFEKVADSDDLETVFEIEALTNDRLREGRGQLSVVPIDQRLTGNNTSYIMAAFTHLNPEGSRFSDGTWGVYYAAKQLKTALAETIYHRTRFLRHTREKPMALPMRVLLADVRGRLHDVRKIVSQSAVIYDANHYQAAQALARSLKQNESNGIIYRSVRDHTGECVAVFNPTLLSEARFEKNLIYQWDGEKIAAVYEQLSLNAGAPHEPSP